MSCKSEPSNSNTSENSEEEKTQITNQVAQAYGIENWDNVEEVNFSFVVNPGENESVRKWSWKPKSNTVTLYQNGDEITYDKNNLDDGYVQTDKAFVNDSFWLLFPFHLVWDNIDFTFEENAISPINKVKCSKIIVRYPQEGGYTPGDRYDVYIDKDHNILEWSYYPSGQREPVLMNTFEDLSGFNGIKVNLTHRNPDTGFQLVFRDVSIK
jgi:hypothetical protein